MKRALISVSDKTNIIELSNGLIKLGWEIVSTGGTFEELKKNGVEVTEVSEVTKSSEMLGGRVKTLHPNIHGGILYRRNNIEDENTLKERDIKGIDMVVVNLYPFKETVNSSTATEEDIIENIDIGGPTLIRAAGKNYKDVIVLTDTADYSTILEELKNGEVSNSTKFNLAKKAFTHTAYYDSMISRYLNEMAKDEFPERLILSYAKKEDLRYGENPHQKASLYEDDFKGVGGLPSFEKLSGGELSYNNLNDINEGRSLLIEFDEPTAVAVKHGNACGVSSNEDIEKAFDGTYKADIVSIYGGVVLLNREVEINLAKKLSKIFLDLIVAPSYSAEALTILEQKSSLTVIKSKENTRDNLIVKSIDGGLLVQEQDKILFNKNKNDDLFECVTEKKPNKSMVKDFIFAWKVVKSIKSNAIVIVKDKTTIALGPGQVSRIWSLENAIRQGGERVSGAVVASDAFFPFGDSLEAMALAGISGVIQPGGSKKDSESIEVANRSDIAMVFTGIRHFKH